MVRDFYGPLMSEVYYWIYKNYGEPVADKYFEERTKYIQQYPECFESGFSPGEAFLWGNTDWGFEFWNDLDSHWLRDRCSK